ncbi:MAG: flagellar hook-associated protein FlgK, partial [Proteobacteria bacterium]|nr:flagellar hook-associated protein FlgK [Pseudomonadota bacterium]
MSIFSIFDIGKNALNANQTAISVTSHNIANVNNPDYSKQEVIIGVNTPIKIRGGSLGRGIAIDNIKRNYDKFLTDLLLNQENLLGRSTVLKDIISQTEELFNEANRNGILNSFDKFFNTLQDLVQNPSDLSKRIVFINNAEYITGQFKDVELELESILNSVNYEMSNITDKINSISKDIAELNKKINQLEAGGLSQANDLRDKRDALLKELSQYVNINYYEGEDGIFYVTVGMRNLVAGGMTSEINFLNTSQGTIFKLDNADITSRITGGKLNGLLTAKDLINNEALYKLRKLFASFTNQFNLIHQNGYDLDNNTGSNFFNPITNVYYEEFSQNGVITSLNIGDYNSLKFDEYYINIKAGNVYEVVNKYNNQVVITGTYTSGWTISFDGIDVVISGAVSAGDKFFISPLKASIKGSGLNTQDPRKLA